MKSSYPEYSETTRMKYVLSQLDGSKRTLEAAVVGTKQVGSKSYSRFAVGDVASAATGGLEGWVQRVGSESVELAGGSYQVMTGMTLPIVPSFAAVTLSQPHTFAITPPMGKAQTFSLSGAAMIGQPSAAAVNATAEGSYTLVESDVAVNTPAGRVSGCSRYTGSAQVPQLFGSGVTANGELYYHRRLGVVKAEMKSPLAGLGLGFAGTSDASDLGGGYASVQKIGVLGKDAEARFDLNTYDTAQKFDADKDTHAKMLLELRWVDEDKAKSTQQPYVTQEFGTPLGYFPSSFTQSPTSFLFPDENGKGYTHWIAFVDQAAKNQQQNGIAYHVNVRYEADFSPIRVAARIVYKRITAP